MNQSKESQLHMMWRIIIENDLRKNMASDFSGEALASAVESIMSATAIEPVDVHHCLTTLDNTMTDLLVQKNGLIVSTISQEEK